MYDLSISIVVYEKYFNNINELIKTFLLMKHNIKIYIIDNSANSSINNDKIFKNKAVKYFHSEVNVGYGSGHNIAITDSISLGIKYHIVLNPDIILTEDSIIELINYMNNHSDTGLIQPKVLYPDGTKQYLCKKLPTPNDLFIRRFSPFKKHREKIVFNFENRYFSYDKIANIPILSGCFFFLRNEVIKDVGMFDERFFLYLEDYDLSRRIYEKYKCIYYPEVSIIHLHSKDSYKKLLIMFKHIISAIKYFNKWGWIMDKGSKEINRNLETELRELDQND